MMYHSTCSFKCLPYLLILGCILTFLQACAPVQRYVLLSSDNGDGTYTNPVINADYPDPDIIRVGEDYYMVSSSFVEPHRLSRQHCPFQGVQLAAEKPPRNHAH